MTKTSRTMVFIDYQNTYLAAMDTFHRQGASRSTGHVDPLRLGKLLVRKRIASGLPSTLAGVRVYRGRPAPTLERLAAAANDRQTDAWQRSPLVHVTRRMLRYPRRWPREAAKEKGIDVALAVDFVRLAMTGAYDVGILVSEDADLLPAIETVPQLTRAHVEVAAWHTRTRLKFEDDRRLWCHWLSEDDYRSVEDLTNYLKASGRPGK